MKGSSFVSSVMKKFLWYLFSGLKFKRKDFSKTSALASSKRRSLILEDPIIK